MKRVWDCISDCSKNYFKYWRENITFEEIHKLGGTLKVHISKFILFECMICQHFSPALKQHLVFLVTICTKFSLAPWQFVTQIVTQIYKNMQTLYYLNWVQRSKSFIRVIFNSQTWFGSFGPNLWIGIILTKSNNQILAQLPQTTNQYWK